MVCHFPLLGIFLTQEPTSVSCLASRFFATEPLGSPDPTHENCALGALSLQHVTEHPCDQGFREDSPCSAKVCSWLSEYSLCGIVHSLLDLLNIYYFRLILSIWQSSFFFSSWFKFRWCIFSLTLIVVLKACGTRGLWHHLLPLFLLLLLSRFSRVQLCATPETAAHQAPPSLGFSRQEHWSGLPLPSPMHESEKWKWSRSVIPDS